MRSLVASFFPTALGLLALGLTCAGCSGGGTGGGAPRVAAPAGSIGAQGGTFERAVGAVSVPAGAIDANQTVTFEIAGSGLMARGATRQAGEAVTYGPAGQTFNTPVEVTIPYSPSRLAAAGLSTSDLRILKRNDATGVVELLTPTSVNAAENTVSVLVTSFSTFQPVIEAIKFVDPTSPISVDKSTALPNGSDAVSISVSLRDRLDMQGISGAALVFSSDKAGTFSAGGSGTTDALGRLALSFTSPTAGVHTFSALVASTTTLTTQPTTTFGGAACAPDTYATAANAALVQAAPGVLANDSDPLGNPITVSAFDATSAQGVTLTMAADGGFTYDPTALPAAVALPAGATLTDSFNYTATSSGVSATCGVTVTVAGVNDAPTAVNDAGATTEDAVLTVPLATGVLSNDTDPDTGATLSVATVTGGTVGVAFALPSGAMLTLNADGSYVFDPRVGHNDLATGASTNDTFSYTVSDGAGGTSGAATVTIAVSGINDAPTGVADTYANVVGNTRFQVSNAPALPARFTGDVMDNDTDPEGQTLSVTAETKATAQAGSVTIDAAGQFTYTPRVGFVGADSFSYTLSDSQGGSGSATVTLTVSNLVWYVVAGGAAGDGRDATPFNSLAQADAATPDANTVVRVTGAAAGNMTLGAGQSLSGKGVALVVNTFTLDAAGATNAIDSTVTLGTNNTIQGLSINRAAAGVAQAGLVGTGFGTLTAPGLAITCGNGSPLNLSNGTLAATTVFSSLTCPFSNTGGVILDQVTGTFRATTLNLNTNSGTGLQATNVAALAIAGGTISAGGGRALDLGTTTGTVTLTSLTSLNSNAEGVRIDGLTGAGTLTVTTTQITSPTNTGVLVQNSPGRTFNFGNTDVTGAGVAAGAVGHGLDVGTSNAASVFVFTDLDLSTDRGSGVIATDQTINVNGTGATVNATGGPALNLDGTTGQTNGNATTGFTWQSLESTTSGTTGLDLNDLATSLSVTGATTISNATGVGLEVTLVRAGLTTAFGATTVTGGASVGVMVGSNVSVSPGSVTFASIALSGVGATSFYVRDTKVCTVTGTLSVLTPGSVAVLLDVNSATGGGATSIGTLNLTTGNQDALTAVANAGTVSVGAGTIVVGDARAVHFPGAVTLNVTLTSVSSTAASTPTIQLESGSTGSFTVAGGGGTTLGGDASGGTISGTSATGVEIQGSATVALRNMSFTNPTARCVRGRSAGAVSVEYSRISGASGTSRSLEWSQTSGTGTFTLRSIHVSNSTSTANAVQASASGAATTATLNVLGSTFTDLTGRAIRGTCTSGTLTSNVGGAGAGEGNMFTNSKASGDGGVEFSSSAGATHTVLIQANTFDAVMKGVASLVRVNKSGSGALSVRGNTVNNIATTHSATTVEGINIELRGASGSTVLIDSNNVLGPFTAPNLTASVFEVDLLGAYGGTHNIRVTNNTTGGTTPIAIRQSLSVQSSSFTAGGPRQLNLLVQNNTFAHNLPSGSVFDPITLSTFSSPSALTFNLTVLDNTVTDAGGSAGRIRLRSSAAGHTVCADVRNNTADSIQFIQTGGTFEVEGPGTAAVTAGDVTTANPGAAGATVQGTVTFNGGVDCPTPP